MLVCVVSQAGFEPATFPSDVFGRCADRLV